ncbi:MAG: hypothetical protein FK734_17045 [Asgard group archaeon]|nr:hypothetical protein [Asgard group archaeon]
MNRKTTKKLAVAMTMMILVIGILGSFNKERVSIASSSFPVDFYQGEKFTWKVVNITTNNIEWWKWNYTTEIFSFKANWHANVSDIISFNVTDSVSINDNYYLAGDFHVGNLSLTTNDYDIAFNLGLTAYPWYGGLLKLEQNWQTLINNDPFNGPNAEIIEDYQITILNQGINSIKILFDNGFQQSELVYDPIIGLLLYANITIDQYSLIITLDSSTIPLPDTTGLFSLIDVISGLGMVTILAIIIYKRKIQN